MVSSNHNSVPDAHLTFQPSRSTNLTPWPVNYLMQLARM